MSIYIITVQISIFLHIKPSTEDHYIYGVYVSEMKTFASVIIIYLFVSIIFHPLSLQVQELNSAYSGLYQVPRIQFYPGVWNHIYTWKHNAPKSWINAINEIWGLSANWDIVVSDVESTRN